MDMNEAIINRHAVRSYQEKRLEDGIIVELNKEIEKCNQEGKLSIQLITEDKKVFKGLMAHFGGFRSVSNYIALIGSKGEETKEKLGYYGEQIVLRAQQLGLNTCWVAVTYKKGKCRAVIKEDQELSCVIALGYGTNVGVPHKSKAMNELCKTDDSMPEWFEDGMKAVMFAPTAMNKQNFCITLENGKVRFEVEKSNYSSMELGIIKYHFQIGSNIESI